MFGCKGTGCRTESAAAVAVALACAFACSGPTGLTPGTGPSRDADTAGDVTTDARADAASDAERDTRADAAADADGDPASDGDTASDGGERDMPPDADDGDARDPDAGVGPPREVERPILARELADRWHMGWRASPVVADLDGDGANEILLPREGLILVYGAGDVPALRIPLSGRIWASPAIADLVPDSPGPEIVATVRDRIFAWSATGDLLPGFPVRVIDELRSLALGDIDGDRDLEIVVASTLITSDDVLYAYHHDGSAVAGFPPMQTGSSGCDGRCYVAGAFDENLAIGDFDGDGAEEIVLTQDNAYFAVHRGTGEVWPASERFALPTRVLGVRLLHDYALSRQGYPNDEPRDLQAHGTNSPPAVVDIDGDGAPELVFVASVQSADQTERELGVALWVLRPDGSRPPNWESPLYVPGYLAGLATFPDANLPEAAQQVAVGDLDPVLAGPEFVFPGLDGGLHAASSAGALLWSTPITDSPQVLVAGPVLADLSRDGIPEVLVTTWGPAPGAHALHVLDATGEIRHRLPLPDPGSMASPTVADVDGDGQLEIVVNLSTGVDGVPQALVFTVPGSAPGCLPWPTGRGNLARNGRLEACTAPR